MTAWTNAPTIVVVDDEPNITEVIRLYLEHANYEVRIMHSCTEAIAYLNGSVTPALLLLDVMLPDGSGFELCQRIRGMDGPSGQVPIIFLTAKGEPMDKLRGFNLGVDDYIVKPFDPNELVARIKAVLRRTGAAQRGAGEPLAKPKSLDVGGLAVDLHSYKVTVGGQRIELTPKEIELLYFLVLNPNRVFSREDLLMHVWKFDFHGGTRTVDAHVKNLRKKLGTHPGWSIETLWGVGYAFEVNGHA
ncbi:response regulator transcription factor [Paenibacillus sp. HJGM_3]|uniref:response regulator transcription factor n=1 Tax=Paenibacillus sp. HJGM_3 TaxID=3379816 RepID=UPI00385B64A3